MTLNILRRALIGCLAFAIPTVSLSVSLIVPFVSFTLLYIFLGVIVIWLLKRQVADSPRVYAAKPVEEAGYAFD